MRITAFVASVHMNKIYSESVSAGGVSTQQARGEVVHLLHVRQPADSNIEMDS